MRKAYNKYQSTNEKWMKTIPSHWSLKRLKGIFYLRKESNNPIVTREILSLTAKQGVIPYKDKIGVGGNKPKTDLTKYNICRVGDLLVNNMNVVSGAAGVSKYMGCVSPVYYPLVLRNNSNCWYYHYIFKLLTFQRSLIGLGKGILMHENDKGTLTSVRMRISMDYLGNVQLPVPPREEQEQIVRFLDWKVSSINKLINNKQQEINDLKELKKATISDAVTHGLDKSVPMKDSGIAWLGKIPQHWKILKLRQILSSFSEKNHPNMPLLSVVREKGVIIRNIEDMDENHNYIPDDLTNYKLVKTGQFAMNKMKAWQGSYGVSNYSGIVSPAYFVFKFIFDIDKQFFNAAIRSKPYVSFFGQASDGIRIGQWDLSMDRMKDIPFYIPPRSEQDQIVRFLDVRCADIDRLIATKQAQITNLHDLKSSLIADVVTGQIDVRDVTIPNYETVQEHTDEPPDTEANSLEEAEEV